MARRKSIRRGKSNKRIAKNVDALMRLRYTRRPCAGLQDACG